MDLIWQELTNGLPDTRQLVTVLIRVIASVVLGGIVGIEREKAGKPAGFRTHILVSLGTALVVLACAGSGMSMEGLSRVIQGIVTGIGFIGAGSILKLDKELDIRGLTTAAGLWLTAAVGVACGLGALGIAMIGAVLALLVLALEGAVQKDKKQA
ncbi:MAG TPA: MgtC/SapB family protein [Pyrinomonadaceae bacterium]|nr:MgtC/SapB family protein [Pyrinomonadaceae bacterium]